MDPKVGNLILKINRNAIDKLSEVVEKNKTLLEKDTFQCVWEMIKDFNYSKTYFPFIATFLICLLRKKAPKSNTILLSSIFLLIENFIDLKNEKLQNNANYFADIANVMIIEELKADPLHKIELLKKIKKIAVLIKKDDERDENLDRLIKAKITDNLRSIVDFLGLIFSFNTEEMNILKIYCGNIARIIFFEKQGGKIDFLEIQKLSMMKNQADRMLNKFEPLGREILEKFSDSLFKNIESNCNQKSLAI